MDDPVLLLARRLTPPREALRVDAEAAAPFSEFDVESTLAAEELIADLQATVPEGLTDGELARWLDQYIASRDDLNVELVRFAVRAFAAERDSGGIVEALDSEASTVWRAGDPPLSDLWAESSDQEQTLLAWRDRLSEHHYDWHNVYRFRQRWNRPELRQGEHFLYMHQQMIARYDAEKGSLGLPPTTPWTLTEALPVGHTSRVRHGGRTRDPGVEISDHARPPRIEQCFDRLRRRTFELPPGSPRTGMARPIQWTRTEPTTVARRSWSSSAMRMRSARVSRIRTTT